MLWCLCSLNTGFSAGFLVKMSGSSIIAVIGSCEMASLSQLVDIYDSKLLQMLLLLVVQDRIFCTALFFFFFFLVLSKPDAVGCCTNDIILILRAVCGLS